MIDQARLKEVLSYDSESGHFTWLATFGKARKGQRAGGVRKVSDRYSRIEIAVDGVRYKAHRLAWLYATGAWPGGEIDHIDRNPMNNAFSNLRDVSHAENMFNMGMPKTNTSGYLGVSWNAQARKWQAQIKRRGVHRRIGLFACKHEAAAARRAAELAYSTEAL